VAPEADACLPAVKIKKTAGVTKFKVRCSRFLYTLRVQDSDKAEKLRQSLPPGAWLQDLHASVCLLLTPTPGLTVVDI